MNKTYGRKVIKGKNTYFKRLILSWFISIMVGLLIGGLVVPKIIPSAEDEPVRSYEPNVTYTESVKYGTVDDRIFNIESSVEWSSGDVFVPLNVPMDEELQEFIYYLCYGYNVDFPFVMAVIECESSFRTDVASNTNDWGLMQINEINHEWLSKELGVTDFLDPYQNVRCGIFMLRKLFEKYEEPAKVLMAYNMGETGAKRLWNKDVYETNYSKKIMGNAVKYRKQIEERSEQ